MPCCCNATLPALPPLPRPAAGSHPAHLSGPGAAASAAVTDCWGGVDGLSDCPGCSVGGHSGAARPRAALPSEGSPADAGCWAAVMQRKWLRATR